jgi:hypothetical protein
MIRSTWSLSDSFIGFTIPLEDATRLSQDSLRLVMSATEQVGRWCLVANFDLSVTIRHYDEA